MRVCSCEQNAQHGTAQGFGGGHWVVLHHHKKESVRDHPVVGRAFGQHAEA